MPRNHIPHRIEHTRNRHSRAVYKEDTIIIRLARGLSETEKHEHIQNLLRRMTRQVLKEKTKTIIDPFRPLLDGATEHTVTLADDTAYVFRLQPGTRTNAQRTADGWDVSVAPGTRRRSLHRFLWSLLAHTERQNMEALVHHINDISLDVHIRAVRLGYAATQWGSCSARGDIMINAILLFMPQELLEYVIVHELAHRRVKNHSGAFWHVVARALPLWEESRKDLQNFRICSL